MRQRVVSSQKSCLICQNCFEHENLLFGHFMIDPFYDFNDFFSSVKKSRNWAVNFVGVGRIVKTNELCNLSAIRDMNSKLKMVSLKSTAFLESNLEISRYSFTQYDTLQRCHDWYYQCLVLEDADGPRTSLKLRCCSANCCCFKRCFNVGVREAANNSNNNASTFRFSFQDSSVGQGIMKEVGDFNERQ